MADNDDVLDSIVDEANEAAADESQEEMQLEDSAPPAEEEAPAEETGQDEAEKMVPLAALHESRQNEKELREQLARQAERISMIQERMDAAAQPAEEAAAEEEPEIEVPDFADDPAGNIDARFQRLERLVTKGAETAEMTAQQQQQADMIKQLESAIAADQGEFMKEHPDYVDALSHIRQIRVAELVDGGYSEEQAVQAIGQAEYQMAHAVLTNKKSPAEVMYNAAVRAGYVKNEGEKAAEDTGQAEEAADIEEADTMGGSGGPSVQELMEADEDEFDQMWQELGYGKKMQ